MDELKAESSLIYLFINYRARDLKKTKLLDNITKNIAIPSQNGKNFTSNLRLGRSNLIVCLTSRFFKKIEGGGGSN
jgi:hypothetical protein